MKINYDFKITIIMLYLYFLLLLLIINITILFTKYFHYIVNVIRDRVIKEDKIVVVLN